MTILEFIRKNSLLVLIVIIGVGAGLVMMDYSGKTSAFSRDFYIKVDGTKYDYAETMNLGENGKEFLGSLISATRSLTDRFDTDGDGRFSEAENAAMTAWLKANPEIERFFGMLNEMYEGWTYGIADRSEDNVGITRAMLHAEADALGLHPSEAQIDAYLRKMPPFCAEDGSFNTELYRRMTGFRNGNANRVQEETFRKVIADMMIWEAVRSLISNGVHYNTRAQLIQQDSLLQSIAGRTAWLPASAVPAPAEPTEEELAAFWEAHKEQYKSKERRIVSVYTLSPAADSNMENLLFTTDTVMQELSLANGKGLDKILADIAENAEYDPFTYLQGDGSTHVTYPLLTQEQLLEQLTDSVNHDGTEMPLAQVAFSELNEAPTAEQYEEAAAAGNPEKNLSIKQIRGFYTTSDNKMKLVRIEAVQTPSVLPYEEAKEQALADLKAERSANALADYAHKLYDDMQATAEQSEMGAAFALAAERGAQVENYGPTPLTEAFFSLPSGVTVADILSTHSGKLTPLAVLEEGARITSVDQRTIPDSPAITLEKRTRLLPAENARLKNSMMQDWMNSSYVRFNVQPSKHVQIRGSKN